MRTPSVVLRHFRHQRAMRRLVAAFVLGPLTAVLVLAGVLGVVESCGCYDTTVKTPPCTVNAHQEGCPAFPTDMRAPDAGRR